MKIHHLKPAKGAHKPPSRKGRGEAGRKGKTAGRGTKGTGARGTVPAGFEGGQMPLARRLPKQPGFSNPNRVEYSTINVGRLAELFADGDEITPEVLRERGLTRKGAPVKILGEGEVTVKLSVTAHAASASALEKLGAAGGSFTTTDA